MEFIDKIVKIFSSPTTLFFQVKEERGIRKAFQFYAILILVPLLIDFCTYYLELPFTLMFFKHFKFLEKWIPSSVIFILIYPIFLIFAFISGGIYHLFAKLWKGKGDYSATFKVVVYSGVPSLLFGWLPYFLFIVPSLYSLYLMVKGFSILHEVSMWRALGIVLMLIILLISISVLIAAVAFLYFLSIFLKTF